MENNIIKLGEDIDIVIQAINNLDLSDACNILREIQEELQHYTITLKDL